MKSIRQEVIVALRDLWTGTKVSGICLIPNQFFVLLFALKKIKQDASFVQTV